MKNQLRSVRENAGLSQVDLAVQAGVQPGQICLYEKGFHPNQHNARKIAEALGSPVDTIFPDYDSFRRY